MNPPSIESQRRFFRITSIALGVMFLITLFASGLGIVEVIPGRSMEWLFPVLVLATTCCGAALAAGVAWKFGRFLPLAILGGAGTGIGSSMLTYVLLASSQLSGSQEETLASSGGTLFIAGLALVHTSALAPLPLKKRSVIALRLISWICTHGFGSLLILLIWFGDDLSRGMNSWMFFELVLILLLFLGVLGSVATVLVPILHLVGGSRGSAAATESVSHRASIRMSCPKCDERQQLTAGSHRCVKCRSRIFIEIEEPRCECGYLLYRLTSSICPECGRPVGETSIGRHASREEISPA